MAENGMRKSGAAETTKTSVTTATPKKKILFIVEAMGGGVFTYIVDLANELANMKNDGANEANTSKDGVGSGVGGSYLYDLYMAYGVRKQTPKDYKRYFDNKIHLIKVDSFEHSINPTKDIRSFFAIKRIAKEIRPDIIHLHSSKAGALGRVALNGFKVDGRVVPLFYTLHGYSFLMKNHSVPMRTACKTIESFCGKLNCTTISCNEGEHEETLKLNKRAVYVDNGINVKGIDEDLRSLKIENHPFTVFTLGRICCQKDLDLFNKIAEAMPDVKFIWIGDGEFRDELKHKNIENTDWVDRKTALEKPMTAHVFILTSLWEGLPISLLEAMYMKKPVFVSDVIGNHDVITNSVNGFMCREAREFVEAMRRVQRDMSDRSFEGEVGEAAVYPKTIVRGDSARLVDKAFEDVMRKYNTKVMAEEYSRIYMGGTAYVVLIPIARYSAGNSLFVIAGAYRSSYSSREISYGQTDINSQVITAFTHAVPEGMVA